MKNGTWNKGRSKETTIDGVTYRSQHEAAKALGVHPITIGRWMKNGKRARELMKCVVEGIAYDSVADAAKANNVERNVVYWWIRKNNGNRIVRKKTYDPKTYAIDGVSYGSVREASEKLNVTRQTIYNWIDKKYKGAPKVKVIRAGK